MSMFLIIIDIRVLLSSTQLESFRIEIEKSQIHLTNVIFVKKFRL